MAKSHRHCYFVNLCRLSWLESDELKFSGLLGHDTTLYLLLTVSTASMSFMFSLTAHDYSNATTKHWLQKLVCGQRDRVCGVTKGDWHGCNKNVWQQIQCWAWKIIT